MVVSSSYELVSVDYDDVLWTTAAAVLFLIDGDEVWLPRSTIELDDDTTKQGAGMVDVRESMAFEKGLI